MAITGACAARALSTWPLADGVALRIAGAGEYHSGYLRSSVTRDADLNDLGYGYVRGSLRIAPASIDGRLEVLVRGSYYRERDHGYNSVNSKIVGSLVDTSLIRQPGQTLTVNGITYPLPFGYNGQNYATGTLVPFTPALRDGIPDIGGADIGIPIGGPYDSVYDYPARQRVNSYNFSGIINFDISDSVRLRSITGYNRFRQSAIGDGDGTPIPFSAFYSVSDASTFQQEFQVQSTRHDSPFQYTFGAFYLRDRANDAGALVYPSHNYSTVTAAANGFPVYYNTGNNCAFTYLPTSAPASCNISNFNSPDGAGPNRALTRSYAGYGQISYRVDDRLTLTLGARYTIDDKDYASPAQVTPFVAFVGGYVNAQNQTFLTANPAAAQAALPFPGDAGAATLVRPGGVNAGFTNGAGYHAYIPFNDDRATAANFNCGGLTPADFAPAGSNSPVGTVPNYLYTRCGHRVFRYATYRVAADYKVTPENLLYASFSTGKHSGGFGTAVATVATPQGEFAPFNTESAYAFEIGSKNQFFDRRLQVNVAAFYNRYTNNQVQGLLFVPASNTNIATITNLGSTKAPGAELQVIVKPTPALTINASVNYLHARNTVVPFPVGANSGVCFLSGTAAGSPCAANTLANNRGYGFGFFPNAYTNPELFVPVTNAAGTITDYQSLYYNQETKVQNTPDWSGHVNLAYAIDLDGIGTLTPEADVLYSGRYLLSASTPLFQQEAYAKVDLRLTFTTANEALLIQGFVQNLTNKATLGRITTSIQSAQGTYSDPRTYGVRVGVRF